MTVGEDLAGGQAVTWHSRQATERPFAIPGKRTNLEDWPVNSNVPKAIDNMD